MTEEHHLAEAFQGGEEHVQRTDFDQMGFGRGGGEAQQQPAQSHERRRIGRQVLADPDAFEPLLSEHRAQSARSNDQRRQQRGPGEIQAQQQTEQDTVVTEQPGLTISLGVVATLRGEQTGDTAQQRTAEQGRCGE
ncbi:hypothetical protein D3C84_683640 [compost metagenome]